MSGDHAGGPASGTGPRSRHGWYWAAGGTSAVALLAGGPHDPARRPVPAKPGVHMRSHISAPAPTPPPSPPAPTPTPPTPGPGAVQWHHGDNQWQDGGHWQNGDGQGQHGDD